MSPQAKTPRPPTAPTVAVGGSLLVAALFSASLYGHGRLLPIHIVLLAVLPVLLTVAREHPVLRHLWLTSTLWVMGLLLSYAIHGGKLFSQYLAAAIFLPLTASGLVWLRRALGMRVPMIVAAVAVGWLMLTWFTRTSQLGENPWKYGFEAPTGVLLLAMAYNRRQSTRAAAAVLVALAATSYYFDSRFYTLVSLLTLALLATLQRVKTPRVSRRTTIATTIVAVVALYAAYPAIARQGWIGDRARTQQQTFDGNGTNYLLSNRMEMPQALYLTISHPLFGIGTNVPLSHDEATAALRFASKLGRPLDDNVRARLLGAGVGGLGYAPHSAALDTTANAGLLALPFWAVVMWHIGRHAKRPRSLQTAPGLLLFLMLVNVWDALFSPLVPATMLSLALLLFLLTEADADGARGAQAPRSPHAGVRRR